MSAPMISGGAALLLQGSPTMGPAQIKLLIQSGSTYMADAGLVGAGAGSVNLWTSRQVQANSGLLNSILSLLLGQSGGASFWDAGTMQDHLYKGDGIWSLSLGGLLDLLLNPGKLKWGGLYVTGPSPIPGLGPNHIVWGDVTYWTANNHIVWGDDVLSPEGQHIVWGDNETTDDYHIVWGDSMMGSPDPH